MAAASLPVYSSLADVVVPANVGPGRSFDILIETNRNGLKKRMTKRLWRASGCHNVDFACVGGQ
eukprot:281061-Prymnesium_polylepis.1